MVHSPCSHCKGHRFDSQSGNQDPTCLTVQQKKKKRILFGSQTPSWPWQPRSHTGVMRGFSGGMDGHVVALLPQSQTPAHPFIQTSPLFSMLLFPKPGASYFLSLKSPTPQPVPGPIIPTQPSATQMPDTYTISSVQFSRSVVSDSSRPHESQHARPPCPSPTPGVHSDSRPSSQ